MTFYVDEDTIQEELIARLRKAGHDVELPVETGLMRAADFRQLTHSIRTGRVFLTHNDDDFRGLHELVEAAGGAHPGIIVVRRDQDSRDMSPGQMVAAVAKLEKAGVPLRTQVVVLNHWR